MRPPTATSAASRDAARHKAVFWQRVVRVLKIVLAINVAIAVWAIGFRGDDTAAPVLPDTQTQFSLDLRIVDEVDHPIVYVVEQRARPFYRIFSFDPANGDEQTVYTVPEDAIIYGISLSPDRNSLAVAYSPDFNLDGNGIWLFDLAAETFVEQTPVTAGRYLTDLAWAADGATILATDVDRTGEVEVLSVVQINMATSDIERAIPNAINPVQGGDVIYFLQVGEDNARRSIGAVDETGERTTVEVTDSEDDLDHLTAAPADDALRVAVLDSVDAGLTVGDAADAHGSHDVPSTWWKVDVGSNEDPTATTYEPIIVFDAVATSDAIVYATSEGLSIATSERIDVIKSRALRFVTG